MPTIARLLDETLRAARAGEWSAYRVRFRTLRGALAEQGADEDLRARLDILNAAAPEHDPQGCLRELEQLCSAVDASGLADGEASPVAPAMDLRGLQPPEPMVRIFQALERAPRQPLRVILPHEPVPLYGLLRERGYTCAGSPRTDGGFEVLIERG